MYDEYGDIPFDMPDPKEDADLSEELFAASEPKEGPIDAVTANYYVGLVKKNKAKEAMYKEQAKEMIEDFKVRVDNWLRTRQNALDFSNQFYLGKLEAYYRENQPSNGKPLSLPEGNIGFYSVPAKFDFDTYKDDIISQLVSKPELAQFIRYTAAINKTDLKKACKVDEDGTVFVGDYKLPLVGYTPKTTEFKTR